VKAVTANLRELHLDVAGLRLYDGSGLARYNRATPRLLVTVIARAMATDHPELAAVLSGLPIAAVTGTLADRFHVVATEGAGIVRGKTGTLDFVSALVGIAQTADGAVLPYAFMANGLKADARPYADRISALLTTCGCRTYAAAGGAG
jgi:serine-type D-Ala-D-Ala carboxypeptidase/endopeptidase (penicillin-binding protein 4)